MISDPSMTSFCTLFKLKSIVKELTCCNNPENPSSIDLFLSNCPKSFHNTCLYETGDFHVLNHCLLKSLNTEITKTLTKMNSDFYSKNI